MSVFLPMFTDSHCHLTFPELASQLPLLKQVLGAMNIPMYELDSWEADDLIGTAA